MANIAWGKSGPFEISSLYVVKEETSIIWGFGVIHKSLMVCGDSSRDAETVDCHTQLEKLWVINEQVCENK